MKRRNKKADDSNPEDERLIEELLVARCLADELKQQEIAEILGKSQAHISRLTKNNPHLYQPSPRFSPRLSAADKRRFPELIALVDQKMNAHRARDRLVPLSGNPDFKVDVVYGKAPITDQQIGFDRRVAKYLSRLIDRCQIVGVAWEHGIKPPSTEIPGFVRRDYNNGDAPVRFMPLCGITSSQESLAKSSTVIAMDYHHLVNRHFPTEGLRLLNLNCIPMVHPRVRDAPEPAAGQPDSIDVMNYIRIAFRDYERIFGPMCRPDEPPVVGPVRPALVSEADMILSGIGTSENGTRTTLDQLYPDLSQPIPCRWGDQAAISRRELLETVVVGDVAGVLLPRLDTDDAERNGAIVQQLNARLATLRETHLRHCVEQSREQGREGVTPVAPGVVIIADGADKRDAVLIAVRLGYVSRLIIDDALAGALGA